MKTDFGEGRDADCLPHEFEFDGHQIRYGHIGRGDPLLLLHGTPFSSIVWRRVAPWLAEVRRVFYFDLLGYGRSAKPAADVSLGVQNELFSALLDHWEVDRPDVVALDYGGATALRTHLLNGRDYRSLTLIDPVAIGPTGSPFARAAREYPDAFSGLPPFIHRAVLHAYVQSAAYRSLSEDVLQLYLEPWLGEVGQAAFYRQLAQMSDRYTDEIEPRLGEVRCPVMIVWGEQDEWIPLDRGKELASRIPGSRIRTVKKAKHLVQEDSPEAIVAIVLSFLSEA